MYLYDVENRLVEKRAQANSVCSSLSYTGTLQAGLRYDPMGRLYETTGAATTRFLHDGDALVGEYNSAGTMLRRYVHGFDTTADDPIAWYEGSSMTPSARRYLHADRQGSLTLIGDSGGNALRLIAYDEYGIPTTMGGVANLTPGNGARFLYTGQAWLPEAGLYHYKARIYSPTLGRFLQVDPVGYDDQMNLYSYVANDPINATDPDGKNVARIGGGFLEGVAFELVRQMWWEGKDLKDVDIGEVLITGAAGAIGGAAGIGTKVAASRFFTAQRAAARAENAAARTRQVSSVRGSTTAARYSGQAARARAATVRAEAKVAPANLASSKASLSATGAILTEEATKAVTPTVTAGGVQSNSSTAVSAPSPSAASPARLPTKPCESYQFC